MKRHGVLLLSCLGIGAALGSQVMHWPEAQEVQETEEAAADTKVTEGELELYISVYTAMQADHDLTIDAVLVTRDISLDGFRDIERRVQTDQRLVDRVRAALLDQAKVSGRWDQPGATASPRAEAARGRTPERAPRSPH